VTRRRAFLFLTLSLLLGAAGALARAAVVPPVAERLAEDVSALTTPEMDGRRPATAGGVRAARHLADRLAAIGLKPGGDRGSFLQSFVLETSSRLGLATSLDISGGATGRLVAGRDFTPHGGSPSGEVSGDVVFVGYGAHLPAAGYDDYASVDVRGKVVLALDGAPPHLAPARVTRLEKLIAAKRHGAAAVLVAGTELPSLDKTAVAGGLVSAALTRPTADTILAAAGQTVAAAADAITAARGPASFATGARARLRVDLVADDVRGANVVGILPGADPTLADEAVVVGAHFDHLGSVGGVVHPGADDNASGTALVLGLARAFATAGGAGRTLVFALFDAEEIGLIGSRHYVSRPALPLARTVAMVNFDMVGRMHDRPLGVRGGDSGTPLRAMVADVARKEGVAVDVHGSPHGASDHSRFYDAGVPVLFFTTGVHGDYHKPTDTADRIDAAGMARVAALAVRVVERLASEPRPVYVKLAPPRRQSSVGGGGAFFGVVALPRPGADGLRLTTVMSGTAAANAGLRDGDVIVRFAETAVDDIEQLKTLIAARRPGDVVSVLYMRDGDAHTTSATLGSRNE
jgi:membrane-associated protease RseP (regulator of RpoE activity)